jgi:hypothetical protein
MATVLDVSILNSFTLVIVFLLVFVGGWGMLNLTNPFKQEKGKSFYGLLAFLVAVVVVLSKKIVSIILFSTPWLVIIGLVAFFFIFTAKMFNVGDDALDWAFKHKVVGWVIFFVALILVFALGHALGPGLLSLNTPGQGIADGTTDGTTDGTVGTGGTATGDFGTNLTFTLFHPKIIAVMFMFLLGTLTVLLLNI